MIARTWQGATKAEDAEAYLEYLRRTGLAEYQSTPGNRGVLGLRRVVNGRAELLLVSLWDSREAIRGFAGDDLDRAVFYPEDDRFLVDRDDQVSHYEVIYQSPHRPRIAPEIFRKRLLIEGYFARPEVTAETVKEYFYSITSGLGLRTYAEPTVHQTGGVGKAVNQGFDAFVPLIDSGIYLSLWSGPRFVSVILFTCAEFDDAKATELTGAFFQLTEWDTATF